MKALIFAAGRGIRMMPLTAERPKPLVEVLGRSLLERVFDVLPEEITEVVLVVGYMGGMIRERFGGSFQGRKISYAEQKEQLGTGNALMACRQLIAPGERFLVIYADDLHDRAAIASGVRAGRPAIFVAQVRYPERFGVVVTDESGRVTGMEEAPKEPKTDLAATGAYLLDSAVFDYPPVMDPKGEYLINSMLLPYMRDHEVYAEIERSWVPIGYPEDIQKAEAALSANESR